MCIALFFITHENIAESLLRVGEKIIQKQNINLAYHEVTMDAGIEQTIAQVEKKLGQLNLKKGILFITDIYGSTPSNIAQTMADKYQAQLLSGVNLPMVIRLLNYRDIPEDLILAKALDGACKGIQHHTPETGI